MAAAPVIRAALEERVRLLVAGRRRERKRAFGHRKRRSVEFAPRRLGGWGGRARKQGNLLK